MDLKAVENPYTHSVAKLQTPIADMLSWSSPLQEIIREYLRKNPARFLGSAGLDLGNNFLAGTVKEGHIALKSPFTMRRNVMSRSIL